MFRIFFIFFFTVIIINGQEKSYPKIDSALKIASLKFQKEGRFKDAIDLNLELIERSRKSHYKKGVGWGYLNIGNLLSTLSQYEESLKYLGLAEKELKNSEDFSLKAKINAEIGKINHFLALNEVALNYYNKGIDESKKIKNVKLRNRIQNYIYACKADNFESMHQIDSMYIYFHKAFDLFPDPITASNLANYFIVYKKNEIDSAKYYLDAASSKINTNAYELFQTLVVLEKYGNFYYEKKEFDKALGYYSQSLAIAYKTDKKDQRALVYQKISKTYRALKNEEKSSEFFQKYALLNDSLNYENNSALNLSVDNLVKQKEVENNDIKENNHSKLIIMSIVGVGTLLTLYLLYTRNNKEKELIIYRQQDEITQSKTEKRNLEHKVNDAFKEVLELAKDNDPFFLARFKEVYPEFCEKFLSLYPNVVASEFIFCTYLKLNFSTKEIAQYTFVTERAIQVRKSRLRKKINIPSDQDLYIWINKI